MTIELDEPLLRWRTLKDVYRQYLAQTPSEEGICAAEVIDRAEKGTHLREVAVQVQSRSGALSTEQADQALVSIKEDRNQAVRMRAIVSHIMIIDAAAGLWFAIGRRAVTDQHELIHPADWNILLMNIEQGAVGRDGLRFENLRCAFIKDVPADHPIRAAMQTAVHRNSPLASAEALADIVSPPTAPSPTARTSKYDGPGRPSTFHLIDREFDRRITNKALEPSLGKQAQVLSAWFKTAHPHLKPYQPAPGYCELMLNFDKHSQRRVFQKRTWLVTICAPSNSIRKVTKTRSLAAYLTILSISTSNIFCRRANRRIGRCQSKQPCNSVSASVTWFFLIQM